MIECLALGRAAWGRVEGRCYIEGTEIGAMMIRAGLAAPACHYGGAYYNAAAKASGQPTCPVP